jgi:hypothetical protein
MLDQGEHAQFLCKANKIETRQRIVLSDIHIIFQIAV